MPGIGSAVLMDLSPWAGPGALQRCPAVSWDTDLTLIGGRPGSVPRDRRASARVGRSARGASSRVGRDTGSAGRVARSCRDSSRARQRPRLATARGAGSGPSPRGPGVERDRVDGLRAARESARKEHRQTGLAPCGHRAARTAHPRSRGRGAGFGVRGSLSVVRSQPETKRWTEPETFGLGPAPGSPCKRTPWTPAACLTTPPPRCDSVRWSSSPSGRLSISRKTPGPAASSVKTEVEKTEKKEEVATTNLGVRIGGRDRARKVIAYAIGARFGWSCWIGAGRQRRGVRR